MYLFCFCAVWKTTARFARVRRIIIITITYDLRLRPSIYILLLCLFLLDFSFVRCEMTTRILIISFLGIGTDCWTCVGHVIFSITEALFYMRAPRWPARCFCPLHRCCSMCRVVGTSYLAKLEQDRCHALLYTRRISYSRVVPASIYKQTYSSRVADSVSSLPTLGDDLLAV